MITVQSYAESVGSPDDTEITERIRCISNELNSEKLHAAFWTCGWITVNGASAGYFYYKAVNTGNKADQVNDMVVAAGSALAVVGNAAAPMVSMYAPYVLSNMPETTHAERLNKLAKAEYYLDYGAALEDFGRSWISQSINIATASIGACVVGCVYRNTMKQYGKNPNKEALLTFCECLISGELQIMSQPMKLVSSQKKYNQKYRTSAIEPANTVTVFVYPRFEKGAGFCTGAVMVF